MMEEPYLPGIRQFDLTGKYALITGGSKGLGYAMAAGLASAGCHIALFNRNAEEGATAAEKLTRDYGINTKSYQGSVTELSEVETAVEAVVKAFGRLDILINSAGINIRGAIDSVAPYDFQKVLKVNVEGTWNACRAVTPQMKKQGGGRIINLASTLGLVGLADRTPYASSKGAVVQMTLALALELAPYHINVNAICPGPFLTEMNLSITHTQEAKDFIIGATALGRWGDLREIQGAAIFLASDASSYMVGSMLTVDGGWTAR